MFSQQSLRSQSQTRKEMRKFSQQSLRCQSQTVKEMRVSFQQSLSQEESCYRSCKYSSSKTTVPASLRQHSTRVTLLLLEGCGEEGATHAPDQGNHCHIVQLHLSLQESGRREGATQIQIQDDLWPPSICTSAVRLHAKL